MQKCKISSHIFPCGGGTSNLSDYIPCAEAELQNFKSQFWCGGGTAELQVTEYSMCTSEIAKLQFTVYSVCGSGTSSHSPCEEAELQNFKSVYSLCGSGASSHRIFRVHRRNCGTSSHRKFSVTNISGSLCNGGRSGPQAPVSKSSRRAVRYCATLAVASSVICLVGAVTIKHDRIS